MSYTNLNTLFPLAVLLIGNLSLGARSVHSAPVVLEDQLLEQVTAGENEIGSGIVIGNSAESLVNRKTGLRLSDYTQQSANSLNLINSTGSAVANVINIWDGSGVSAPDNDGNANSEVKINQFNNITQEQVGAASVSGYLRSEAEHTEISQISGSTSHDNNFIDYHQKDNIQKNYHSTKTVSNAEVNTQLKFNLGSKINFSGHLGTGIAVAGSTEITLGGGSADIGVAAEGKVYSGSNGEPLVADGNLALVTRIELPKIELNFTGTGCAVAMGSCSADSEVIEATYSYTDNSSLDIVEHHQSGQNSFSEIQLSIHRSPFELDSAKAEYIVIDDSMLEINSEDTLELSDSAQKNVKGMNVVNAIGSNVANATNLSRTRKFEGGRSKLVLNQFNTVRHGY